MRKLFVFLKKTRQDSSRIAVLWGEGVLTKLKGIAWDHRRCWGPLEPSCAPYRATTGVEVTWDRRSLYSFGEGDLGAFCKGYDLVIYDHPFAGDAAVSGWLLDLSPYLTPEDLAAFAANEVGASWRSYASRGGIWGLPVDTAAQTGAWRPDLLSRFGETVPETLDDVLSLAARLRPHDVWIGWPAVPTDQMCTLFSVAASLGLTPGRGTGPFLDPADAPEIVGWLRRLWAAAHPQSRDWNPIRCLDRMASADDVAYVPYLFNYVTYSTGKDRSVRFGAAPRVAPDRPAHTLLGGAGIGISAASANPQAAFDYAMHLCTPEFQSGDYVRNGGQPGSRAAWLSTTCNELTDGFFTACLPVLDAAHLRPTLPGFVPFFRNATHDLAAVLAEDAPLSAFVDSLNAGFDRLRSAADRVPA